MSSTSTATSGAELPSLPLTGASPREVRAALHPEFRDAFDRAYRASLDEAGRSLELAAVHETIEQWRIRSWVTRDRREHRRVVRRAHQLLHGAEPPDDEPVDITESRL